MRDTKVQIKNQLINWEILAKPVCHTFQRGQRLRQDTPQLLLVYGLNLQETQITLKK